MSLWILLKLLLVLVSRTELKPSLPLFFAVIGGAIYEIQLTYKHGATLGKRRYKIKVVMNNGSKVTLAACSLRWAPCVVLYLLEGAIPVKEPGPKLFTAMIATLAIVGVVMIARNRRPYWDLLAGTKVVKRPLNETY